MNRGKLTGLLCGMLAAGFGWSAERAKVGVFAGPGASGVGAARWLQITASSPDLDVSCVERAEEVGGLDLLVVPEGDAAQMAAVPSARTRRARSSSWCAAASPTSS